MSTYPTGYAALLCTQQLLSVYSRRPDSSSLPSIQIMQNLALEEGEIVSLKSASLPKGTYVKLQPHTKDFLDISNPKAVLETTLRNFSCLTVGDQITINYNNRQYFIDIVEAKPGLAISVVETDCEVDFAPPLDYVEPSRPEPAPALPQQEPAGVSHSTAALAVAALLLPLLLAPDINQWQYVDTRMSSSSLNLSRHQIVFQGINCQIAFQGIKLSSQCASLACLLWCCTLHVAAKQRLSDAHSRSSCHHSVRRYTGVQQCSSLRIRD